MITDNEMIKHHSPEAHISICICSRIKHALNNPNFLFIILVFPCQTSLICCHTFFSPRNCTDVVCCVIFIVVILGYIALGTVGEFETLLLLTSRTFHNDTRPHTQIHTCSEMFWSNRGLEVLIAHPSCSARLYKAKSLAAGISGKVKSDNNIPQTKCSTPQDAPFGCFFVVVI